MKKKAEVHVKFQLKCRDSGTPVRSIISTGEVLLRDINDNDPVIHNQHTNVSIMEDSAPERLRQGFRVLQVSTCKCRVLMLQLLTQRLELFRVEVRESISGHCKQLSTTFKNVLQ